MAHLKNSPPVDTSLEINVKYKKDDGELLFDPTIYKRLVRSLVNLTITQPDISYAINLVSQFMTTLQHLHFGAVQQIIHYFLWYS